MRNCCIRGHRADRSPQLAGAEFEVGEGKGTGLIGPAMPDGSDGDGDSELTEVRPKFPQMLRGTELVVGDRASEEPTVVPDHHAGAARVPLSFAAGALTSPVAEREAVARKQRQVLDKARST